MTSLSISKAIELALKFYVLFKVSIKITRWLIDLEQGKTWIELTRRKEHLDLLSGILNEKLTQLLSLETIKDGSQL